MDTFNSDSSNGYQQEQIEIISHMSPDLYRAASEGNFEPFRSQENLADLLTPNKNTILHIYITTQANAATSFHLMKLLQKYQRNENEFLEKVMEKCPPLLSQANSKGETPLHIAARYGRADIIMVLLVYDRTRTQQIGLENGIGTTIVRMETAIKETALHEAVRNKHHRVVKILTEDDPHLVNLANDAGETPLYIAADRGYSKVVFEILKTCNSMAAYVGPSGRTALHAAVISKDAEMMRKILDKNKVLTRKVDQQGWTALHHASDLHSPSLVEQLLRYNRSCAYIRDKDGRTPLLVAAASGRKCPCHDHMKAMKIIISQCPDCCELVDHRGRNFFHFLTENFIRRGMSDFLKHPSLINLINQKDVEGNTPLHLLASVGFNCKEILSHHLVDKKAINNRNLTALEIIIGSNFANRREKAGVVRSMWKIGHRPSKRNEIKDEPFPEMKERVDSMISELRKAKDAHLIVATLVATVTFAAGFALPGGYDTDKGFDRGSAILSRKAAFTTFLVTDTLALVFSISAIFIHFNLAMQTNSSKFFWLFCVAFHFIIAAMASMVLAFTTGIYAVLPHSSALRIVICVIASCLFIFCCFILCASFCKNQIKPVDVVY